MKGWLTPFGVAIVGVLGETLHHDSGELSRHARIDDLGRNGDFVHLLVADGVRVSAVKGREADQHFV